MNDQPGPIRRTLAILCVGALFFLAAFLTAAMITEPPGNKGFGLVVWVVNLVLFASGLILARSVLFRSRLRFWPGQTPMLTWAPTGRRVLEFSVWGAAVVGAVIGVWIFSLASQDPNTEPAKPEIETPTQKEIAVGDPVPDLAVRLVDGSPWSLDDTAGEVTVLHFWHRGSDESLGQMRRLRLLRNELGADAFNIVGICRSRGEEFPAEIVEEFGATWPQVYDRKADETLPLFLTLGVGWRGGVWVIGSDGVLVARDARTGSIEHSIKEAVRDLRMLGAPAPEITTTTIDNAPWRLSEHRGKVVLIDFWATWCGPCKAETPVLKTIHDMFGNRLDIEMVGIALDQEAGPVLEYNAEAGAGWTQLLEPGQVFENSAAKTYQVRGIPSIWLIDRSGRVVGIGQRGEELIHAVRELMAAESNPTGSDVMSKPEDGSKQ